MRDVPLGRLASYINPDTYAETGTSPAPRGAVNVAQQMQPHRSPQDVTSKMQVEDLEGRKSCATLHPFVPRKALSSANAKMASRPPFKQENSYAGSSYEMKAGGSVATEYSLQNVTSPANGASDSPVDRFKSTYEDNRDMYRMNKKQELRRNFRFLSIFGYSLILGNGWVLAIIGVLTSLTNGGTAGGIWGYFIVICGLSFTTLSMAEMASMAPTAGGQ